MEVYDLLPLFWDYHIRPHQINYGYQITSKEY